MVKCFGYKAETKNVGFICGSEWYCSTISIKECHLIVKHIDNIVWYTVELNPIEEGELLCPSVFTIDGHEFTD
jgi:hypothetical protein